MENNNVGSSSGVKNQKGIIAGLVIVILVLTIVLAYVLVVKKAEAPSVTTSAPASTTTPVSPVNIVGSTEPAIQKEVQVQAVPSETEGWKTFISKVEGFTIKYPTDWKVEDDSSGNCGHKKLNGSDCRDRYYITSPDGIQIMYVMYDDENDDKTSCGGQSYCYGNNVTGLDKLDISNLGQVYLVKENRKNLPISTPFEVHLHKPIGQDTVPVLGMNKHSNFDISFSMPSKLGGRYSLRLTEEMDAHGNTKFDKMTEEQFFNLDSVKKGILILKSLSY